MKNFAIICFLSLNFFFSCEENKNTSNEKEEVRELEIKNQNLLKTINDFIANTKIYPVESHRDVLFYFHIDKKDTVIDLINQAPYECENLVSITTYKKYKIFFYTRDQLKNRLKELVDIKESDYNINCNEIIDTSVYVSYQESFILNNDSITQMVYSFEGDKDNW